MDTVNSKNLPDRTPRGILHTFVLIASGLLAFTTATFAAEPPRVSPLSPIPDWNWLEQYQGRLRRSDVLRGLEEYYAQGGTAAGFVEVGARSLRVRTSGDSWKELQFAPEGTAPRESIRFWRKGAEMGTAPEGKPLQGVRIAIDPGHLGGTWAKMEERYFKLGNSDAVAEGDLTLRVAKRLKPQLEKLGAEVVLLRKSDRPNTPDRPESLVEAATADLTGDVSPFRIRTHSELFFYRISEIRARARLVNEQIRPDIVLCLHFNAEEWGEPESPQLVVHNHLHALVNGSYSAKELGFEDIRSEMLDQLFSKTAEEAVPLNETVAEAVAAESGLPPFTYFSNNARRVGSGPYVYTRNLLANRLYRAPVVFLEPYVMNSEPVWKRVQLGDYSGVKKINGIPYKSLVAEYADGVTAGLARYYATVRH
ncbi:MAG: N-acetylmuramoyl-L-alanine amidase [Verrucomicrobiota bacterium]